MNPNDYRPQHEDADPTEVECPACGGAGEHVTPHRDPAQETSRTCGWCDGYGEVTPAKALECRTWLEETAEEEADAAKYGREP